MGCQHPGRVNWVSVEGAPMCRVPVPQWGEEGACMGGEPEQGGVGVPVVAGK